MKIVNVWKRFRENHILTALTAQEPRTLPLRKHSSHPTAAPAKTLVLTSCAPGEMLLLASADGGETAPGVPSRVEMCTLTTAPVGESGTSDPDSLCFLAPCPFVL